MVATQDLAIAELQMRSLALAEVASELIRRVTDQEPVEETLPSREDLLDIALSLLFVESATPAAGSSGWSRQGVDQRSLEPSSKPSAKR